MYSWYQNSFHVIEVLIVFHAANEKIRKKKILKQDSKSRKENQNVVVVANPHGSSSLRCRTAIATLSHRYCYDVTPMLHRYRYAVAPLSLRCCTAIAPISFRCCSATVAPLLRRCRTDNAPLSLHCRSAAPDVNTQSHRYRSTVAPLLLM